MVSSLAKNEDADEDMDDVSYEKHRQLLQTITSKTKRKIQPTTRNEPSLQVSEFHLSSGQQTTNVDDLTNALKKKAPQIRQKIQVAKSTKKLLQKPLDKVHAEKIKRAVAYDNFKKHISRWSAVVEQNKSADQLRFPLRSSEVEVFDNRMVDFTRGLSHPTDLQKKISSVLQSSDIIQQKQKDLKMSWIEKEKEKYPLTLKELLEKRKSMANFRAKESYRHAKAHRQNKIKSKKYHRLLRKEKTKEQIKEFEKLQDTDPVAALEKLNVIEKTRAEERASLRHKSTGQWARNHVVRAKYDKDSRIALAEQLRKSKELTQKVQPSLNETNNSDSSDEEQIEIPEQVVDPDNPWLAERKEFKDFMAGYNNFVQNNCESKDINDQCINNKLNDKNHETKESEESNVNEVKTIDKIKKKKNNKVKNITVHDLSTFDEEESFVEVLKIVTPKKKKVHFSNDTIKSETEINENDTNMQVNSKVLCDQKNNNIGVINTVAGTWFVSSDNINDNLNKKKVHKDVENAFKNVEIELKNKINEKLLDINKVKVKQPSKTDLVKRQKQETKSDYLKMNSKRKKAEFNEPLYEDNRTLDTNNISNIENNLGSAIKVVEKPIKQVQNIDPTEFLKVTQISLETEEMPQVEDHLDDKEENEQEKLIAEAFADDDIINEFKEEKKKLEEQSKPKIETALPGWGSWAGPNIRKRAFKKRTNMGMFRTPAKPPRKDFNREKVIIHENADDSIKSHLVSELPYPFKGIEEYEETIKVPVGRTWVPETVFQKLTAPPVVTQMGQIIDPIDENSVVKIKLND
ncbi:U3 small nucleolar RNA-associated protein 14 homolog A [Myzus persicae]|uniref:U3 small nucleolar RNA-associated protein 14 homolog A n=1 Tax=Myzus persicae TaxID=13164 RepID=UPI000B93864A|nr:U3 small nucleolar RNA-associated protein 14 homolog A [Myzus persicae]XP_022183769.1 U3 small nucleolar RNA-associated protein 14 homolog A [Myzus persicae]